MSISLVAHNAAASGNGTSVTTVGVDTTGADSLYVVVSWLSSGGGITLSDSVGGNSNTWTALTAHTGDANLREVIYYCKPTHVGAGHTVTIATTSGSIFPSVAFAAFSGSASSSLFDVENGNKSNGADTTLATGSITPGNANELIIAGFCGNGTLSSIDSGFTLLENIAPGGQNYGVGLAYLIQTSAAAVNPTWTTSSGFLSASIASFNPSGGAPPAGGLFLPAQLAGLGSGGPFFQNPLN